MPAEKISSPQSRIDSALGKILRQFNLLELNLGLCIRFLENPEDIEASHAWLSKSSIQDKADRFVELISDKEIAQDHMELEQWQRAVSETRCLRNYYVHGTWEYLPLRKETPVGFRIPPWRTEKLKDNHSPKLTLDELEDDATAVKSVFDSFMRLRKKYGV